MYLRVSSFRRFAIYIIDIGLITIVSSLLLILVLNIIGFDTNRYNNLYDSILNSYADYITGKSDYLFSNENMNNISEYFKLYMIREAIRWGISFVLIILYLVVLPYFVKWQTLGRLITRSIVINDNGVVKPSFSRLLIREAIGTFVFYILFGGIIGLVSVIIAIVTEKSLVDRISKTIMVLDTPIPVENIEGFRGDFFQNKEDDYYQDYENKFKEYDNNEKNDKSDIIDVEVKEINDNSNDDDDEYRVI